MKIFSRYPQFITELKKLLTNNELCYIIFSMKVNIRYIEKILLRRVNSPTENTVNLIYPIH